MPKMRPSLREKFSYRVDNMMSLNPAFKLFGLFGFTFLLVMSGGAIYWMLAKRDDGFIHGMWAAWTFIADAGTQGGEETTLSRALAMFITIGGMMIFAMLLGLVSETLGEKVDDLKKGRSRVIEEGHSLILGWNEKIFTIVQQLIEANESQRRGVIVILSTMDKESMEEELRDSISDFKTSVVVCRSGSTTQASDLLKVNAAEARSIIVLGDDKNAEESDIRATKTVLALQRAVGNLKGHLVVELMDSENKHMIEMVGHGGVEVIAARDVIGRLMVQTARQNGLAHTYANLLAFEGSEFYLKAWKQADGKKFGDVWAHFPDAVVCGVHPAKGSKNAPKPGEPPVIINPPDDFVLGPGDELLVLAEDDDGYTFKPNASSFKNTVPPTFTSPPRKIENLLFLGWRSELGQMIRELDNYVVPGSTLTLVSTLSRDDANERLKAEGVADLKNMKLAYKRGDLAHRKDLEALHVETFDSILVLADEVGNRPPDEVDAHTLMSLLLIRDIQRKNNVKGSPVLSEIRDPRTKELAAIAEASDYVVSNEITSMLMAQVSEKREMNAVWMDLFDSDGNEIYLKHAQKYAATGEKVTFFDLYARGRKRGEVVVGYRIAANEEDESHGIVINPAKKDEPIAFQPDDRIIVLANDET